MESFHQAGDVTNVRATFAALAGVFDRFERPEIAATIYGTATHSASTALVPYLPAVVVHLRTVLGASRFDECVATGAAMELADAVRYARGQIRLAQSEQGLSTFSVDSI